MEGAWFQQLGCYLIVDRSEDKSKVKKIFFAKDRPPESSDLARCIVRYIRGHALEPVAELDFSGLTDFQKDVYAIISKIPRGKTITYGRVAILLGKPGASRAVGQAMSTNPFAIVVPCHRVVSSKGFGGYRWGKEIKEKLLALEQKEFLLPYEHIHGPADMARAACCSSRTCVPPPMMIQRRSSDRAISQSADNPHMF